MHSISSELAILSNKHDISIGIAPPLPFTSWHTAISTRPEYAPYIDMANYADPRFVLPTANSIIVIADSYTREPVPEPLSSHLARIYYALSNRGHPEPPVLAEFNDLLAKYGTAKPFLPAVRPAAIAAGLVQQRSNCLGYLPSGSSLALLYAWVTDIKLEPNSPLPEVSCGDCRACIAACPTGALMAPYHLDPKLCLDSITVTSGVIPKDLRPLMKTWILGCDACQTSCPVNHKALQNVPVPRPLADDLDLLHLMLSTPAEYACRWHRLFAGRIDHAQAKRNAAIAVGNQLATSEGSSDIIAALETAMTDEDRIVRVHAAWALGRTTDPAASPILSRCLKHERDPDVSVEIRSAMRPDGCN